MGKKLNKKLEKVILFPICVADAAICLAAVPVLVGTAIIIEGEIPSPIELVNGYIDLSKSVVEEAFDIMKD